MGLYMDRHDVPETVSAEIIANMHQEDLKIQEQFGCRAITYWYDEKRKKAFCLMEAPNARAIQDLHDHAHGQIPNSIIEVNASLVESFLGRIEDPQKLQDAELNIIAESALRTIMIISLHHVMPVSNLSVQFKSSLHHLCQTIREHLENYDGKLVKHTEFHFLVSFKSISNAVHAALEIQKLLKDFKYTFYDNQIYYKIGLSAGEPVTEKKLIFDEAIKLAERMCKIIKGEVIVASEVKEIYNSENPAILSEEESVFCMTPMDEKFLTLLSDFTESNWCKINLKLDDFSKPLGCSKSQLYRKMILLTGKSPNNFILEYRLNEALNLLIKNTSNITDIAYKTGFSSPSYFSKCFKKRFGHVPSEY